EAARQKRFLEGSGLPIRISTIELIEIGAGGGSIATVDEIGLLKVGPRSAGSQPGPAAYGLGGGEPTVTDADFVLGYLNPDYFAGGEMRIDMTAARAALERLAARLKLSLTECAWGIHDVVNENRAGAARGRSWPTPGSSSSRPPCGVSPTAASSARASISSSISPTAPTTTPRPAASASRWPSRAPTARSSRSRRPTCRWSSSTSASPCG